MTSSIFGVWRHIRRFQKIHFCRTDFRKNWHDCSFWRYKVTEKNSERFRHFWRRYDVIIFCRWRHFRRFWWRHNDVKNGGIVLNFFMRTFIVKMNNRANFYKNRNGGSLFSGNFFVLFYFTRLWDNGGVYYRTFLGHVTPYPQRFFLVFFAKSSKKKFP